MSRRNPHVQRNTARALVERPNRDTKPGKPVLVGSWDPATARAFERLRECTDAARMVTS